MSDNTAISRKPNISWWQYWWIVGEFYVDCPEKSHARCLHVNMYNLNDFVCCTGKCFHQLNHISKQHWWSNLTLWGICFNVQFISKQIAHPYICNGSGYLACQMSCAMLSQWGLVKRKSPVLPASVAQASFKDLLSRQYIASCYESGLTSTVD